MEKDYSKRVIISILIAICIAILLISTWSIRERKNDIVNENSQSGEDITNSTNEVYENEIEEENTFNFSETQQTFKLETNQVYVLEKSNEYFDNIYIGEDLSSAITRTKIEPESIEDFDGNVALTWEVEPIGGINVLVVNNKILRKERLMYSDSIKGVSFSKETKTEIEDLKELEGNLKRGMHLNEVVSILGDKYIVTFEDAEGYKYMWYDKKEQYIEIYFTKTNEGEKVDFVGSCYSSN